MKAKIIAAMALGTFVVFGLSHPVAKTQVGTWEPVGPSGGAMGDLAVHPTQTNLMVVLSESYPRAIYKSTDAGRSWRYISHLNSWNHCDAAIDPFDPAKIFILLDRGLNSSDDGGTTWAFRPFPEHFWGTGMLLADRTRPGVLWATARRYIDPTYISTAMAVLKSTDGGATWTGTSLSPDSYTVRTDCLAQDPSNPDVLYVGGATSDASGLSPRIYRTSDGGATWAAAATPDARYPFSIAVDPSDSRRLLCGTEKGLFLSPDGGASWQKVLDAAHIWHMAFDPGNSRVVYAGDYDRVYKSADGGSTWQAGPSGTIANGCQALVAVAPGRLFVSSSAGIRFSGDAGMTWADRMEGIRARPVCGIAVAPSSPQIVYFGGWPGDFYRSADFGETVTRLPFPPNYVSKIQVNPADADDLFVGASGLLRSRDGGQTWTSLLSRCADFALGRSNVHHIFASGIETFDNGDRSRVTFFKSLDGGSSWESRPIIDDAQGPVGASAVTVDAAGEGTLYLGANYEEGWHDREGPGGGLVFKSADGGATWTEVVRWPGNNIYDITADPKTPGLLFLAAAQGIYKSQDGGATWRKTGQMNGGYVVDFEFNPVDSREVWFGTYDDVYFSPDRGETWSRTYGWDYWSLVRQIDFSPDGALLYAGTGNTGAFRMRRSGAVLSAQVSGTVASAAGVPIPGALIALTNSPNTATTDDAGRYSVRVPAGWSGTLTPSANGWTFNPPNRQSGPLFADVAGQDFAGVPAPTIGLSRKRLNFGAVVGGPSTPAQSLRVFNAGAGTLDWWVGVFAPWLSVAPKAGTNAQTVFISVDPTGLAAGSYVGTLGFAAAGSSNSPQEVEVRLTVLGDSSDRPPYGHLDTPVDGSPAAGSVAVTGWALDDVEVRRVEVKRDPAAGDAGSAVGPDGLVFVGNAVFVPGARADVAAAYPDAPQNGRAGWGYLLLTNMLPNGGNGTFVIHAVAFDSAGQATRLGRTTLHCDNANAVAPFGAIDTPTQGGIASGPAFANFGWALTPWPKEIPRDGSTIWVFVDGVPLGHPAYNLFRRDIFDLFPGYANRDGAVGHFVLDTTKYADGLHSIAWGVADGAGEKSGIGSRFFTIQNGGSGAGEGKVLSLRPDLRSAMALELASPGDIEVEEMEPVESAIRAPAGMTVVGWGETLGQDLPVGSTLDPVTGLFSWIPGPGFLGRHVFHFAATDGTRVGPATEVVVRVVPRDYGRRLAESREKSRRIKKER